MRRIFIATASAVAMTFAAAAPALAVCEEELADADAALQASQTVTEEERVEAAALLAEAEGSLAAGNEAACLEAVTQAQSILGEDHEPDAEGGSQ